MLQGIAGDKAVQKMRSRHRVVHVSTVHHPSDPRIFHKELGTLHAAGYDAHLVASGSTSGPEKEIPIHALPEVSGRYRRILLQGPAYRKARALQADAYHIHDPELIPLSYLLKKTTGARVIYDMHENYRGHGPVEGRLLRALERWCFRWVDHVVLAEATYRSFVAPTRADATLIANYFLPASGAPSVDPTATAPEEGPWRLLYTGVVAKSRGLFHCIDLADQLRRSEIEGIVDLVGICYRDADRERAERLIARRKLNEVCRRTGWRDYVPPDDMVPYYQRAHVGLALFEPDPNHRQSLLTKFYEYMHYGLPILCSDFPLWQRFIGKHECGVTVPPGDTEAAMEVLRRWSRNPETYQSLARSARKASTQYRWSKMGSRLVQLYDRLLGIPSAASEHPSEPRPTE
jgi:glycosyltransferase involved in cell wall biosynthesis